MGSGDKKKDEDDMHAVSEEDLLGSFSGNLARRGFAAVDEARVREVMGKPPLGGPGQPSTAQPDAKPLSTSAEVKQMFVEKLARTPYRPGLTFDPVSFLDGNAKMQNTRSRRPVSRTPRPARLLRTGFEIHFTNLWFLSRFMTPMGKIMPRNKTGLSKKKQRNLGRAIRRAQQMGLMSYFHRYVPGILERTEGEAEPSRLAPPEPAPRNRNNPNASAPSRTIRRMRK